MGTYQFSDGFPDQFGGERGEKYKSKTFKRFILVIQSADISEQKELMFNEFETWRGDIEQLDDVCMIGIQF